MSHPNVTNSPQGTCVEWCEETNDEFIVLTWQGYRPSEGESNLIRMVTFKLNYEKKALTPIKASVKQAYGTWECMQPKRVLTDHIKRVARAEATKVTGKKYWKII